MEVLNPSLYTRLQRKFGTVKIANQGEAQVGMYRDEYDFVEGRKVSKLHLVHPGEYYVVNCPFCNDSKYRLYVNHMWGVRDEEGATNLWLAMCFNETFCMADYRNRAALLEDLTEHPDDIARVRIREGTEVDIDKIEVDWPGPMTRVDELPRDHIATQYLIGRGFDPDRIGKFYNVHFCHSSFRWMAVDKLIIPVYENKVLKGWQARPPKEMNWSLPDSPPKYYTCPGTPRRMLVYNLANASQYKTGVVVEGTTDVWGFGPMACCTLGDSMTHFQRKKICKAFEDQTLILLYDPEAMQKPKVKTLMQILDDDMKGRFCAVTLPEGRDPGNMERSFCREYVRQEARKKGIRVSWKKR